MLEGKVDSSAVVEDKEKGTVIGEGEKEATLKVDSNGTAEVVTEGKAYGMPEGTADSIAESITGGLLDSAANAVTKGSMDDAIKCIPEGTADAISSGATDGMAKTVAEEAADSKKFSGYSCRGVRTKAWSMVKRMVWQMPLLNVIAMLQQKLLQKEQ